jgi:arylsulfatase A
MTFTVTTTNQQSLALAFMTCMIPGLHTACTSNKDVPPDQKPNIIFILADDMGYGDVASLNPGARTHTPAIDRMVSEGITFTNAHASASVCTPSRYGILTGRYAQRSSTGAAGGIMGFHKAVIELQRETLASLLKKAGYTSACIGKWHLGLDWQTKDGSPAEMDINTGFSNVDYNREVLSGPNDYGFDYSYIHPASLDIPPYMFLKNHQVIDPDVILTTDHYPARKDYTEYSWDKKHTDENAVYWEKGVWWRQGEMSRSFRVEDCHSEILREGIQFIETQSTENPNNPFFLYLPLTGPHTPWVPTERFRGKSPIGLYGDFIMDIDDVVDQIQNALTRHNIAENTILIFTSDNGGYWPQEEIDLHGHDSNWGRLGQKGDVWDGGHRIPLVVSWPARIDKPFKYNHLVSLTDFFATLADLTDLEIDDHMGEDSFSLLHVINGDKEKPVRPAMTHYSSRRIYSIRQGEWKFIDGLGSGGFTDPAIVNPQPGGPQGQLYRIITDSLESENLYMDNPDKVKMLQEILEASRDKPDKMRMD